MCTDAPELSTTATQSVIEENAFERQRSPTSHRTLLTKISGGTVRASIRPFAGTGFAELGRGLVVRGYTQRSDKMDMDKMKGKWNQLEGEIKGKWGQMTDDDLQATVQNF